MYLGSLFLLGTFGEICCLREVGDSPVLDPGRRIGFLDSTEPAGEEATLLVCSKDEDSLDLAGEHIPVFLLRSSFTGLFIGSFLVELLEPSAGLSTSSGSEETDALEV